VAKICSLASSVFVPFVSNASDPLLQLNVLDLVGRRLCSHIKHVAFLFRSGFAEWVVGLASGDGDPLLGGDALRVVSAMFATSFSHTPSSASSAEAAAASGGGGGEAGASQGEQEEILRLVQQPELMRRFLKAACDFGDASSEAKNLAAIDAVSQSMTR
jgi:hypothetical protein